MKDYSQESFDKFKEDYPDYPFAEELASDFRLQNYFFLPFPKPILMEFLLLVAICLRNDCCWPTKVAYFRGLKKVSPFIGGRPVPEWFCFSMKLI